MRGSIIVVSGVLLVACGAGVRVDPGAIELLSAAETGDVVRLKGLLAKGASPNVTDASRSTPLIVAACRDHLEVVRVLLERLEQEGAEAKQAALRDTNAGDWTPLRCAARLEPVDMRTSLRFASAQKLEMVRLLLAAGADVNAAKTGVRTPLMEAARTRQVAMVKELLGAGARVDATDYEGRTPLWWAVRSVAMRSWGEGPIEETSVKVVSTLLEAGAVVDSRDRDGRTPLFEAAADGHAEEVRVLLASGADPNALAKRPFGGGGTALLEAAARGQAETAGLLLRAGADPTVGEKQGGGALVAAAQSGSVATALTVLDGHMGASAQALRGALLEGARRGNIGLVRLLLERGARLETGDIDGLEVTGDPRILDLLRQE